MSEITVGVDIGNYDVKTQLSCTPSSYTESEIEPLLEREILYFKNRFYAPNNERNNHQDDKTLVDNGNYLIVMTLFAIAKEIIKQIKSSYISGDELQKKVTEINSIKLGVGLPVGHFAKLSNKTTEYYNSIFVNGISFGYKSEETSGKKIVFNFTVNKIGIYPQDVLSVIKNHQLSIPREYRSYYILGWGGGTLDIIPVRDGVPTVADCESLTHGSTELYSIISKMIKKDGEVDADYGLIEDVLNGRKTVLSDKLQERINQLAQMFVEKTVDELIHKGLKLKSYPTVFIGGAALLLKPFINKSKAFAKIEFVNNVNENAIFYAKAI